MLRPVSIATTLPPPPASGTDQSQASAPAFSSDPAAVAPPIWVRPPKQSEPPCPHTGLRHAAFYSTFVGCPRIRQARMGKGRDRGTRLLWLPDVFAEIARRAEEQANEGGQA
jgi:hypothetical protein